MSKRGVILLLCCALNACEREEARAAAREPAKHSIRERSKQEENPARERAMKSRDSAPEAKIQAEERAASRDAELQKLLQVEVHDVDPFGGRAGPDDEAIATLYGSRYPLAGIRWLSSLGPMAHSQWWTFTKAYYAADPQGAIAMLDQLPLTTRDRFADGLCQAAGAADRELLWEMTSSIDSNFSRNQAVTLQGRLIGNQARSDPAGAWQLARERMPPGYNEKRFIQDLVDLDPGTPYPASLFDRIPPEDLDELLNRGLQVCSSRENVAPLALWLAAKPPSPELDVAYASFAGWERGYGDAAKAREWAEKIIDPVRRERAIRELPTTATR